MDKIQFAISMLKKILDNDRLTAEEIEQAIDILEVTKDSVGMEEEEAIDKMDEMQDYFEYLLTANKPFDMLEIKQEITGLIETLEKC